LQWKDDCLEIVRNFRLQTSASLKKSFNRGLGKSELNLLISIANEVIENWFQPVVHTKFLAETKIICSLSLVDGFVVYLSLLHVVCWEYLTFSPPDKSSQVKKHWSKDPSNPPLCQKPYTVGCIHITFLDSNLFNKSLKALHDYQVKQSHNLLVFVSLNHRQHKGRTALLRKPINRNSRDSKLFLFLPYARETVTQILQFIDCLPKLSLNNTQKENISIMQHGVLRSDQTRKSFWSNNWINIVEKDEKYLHSIFGYLLRRGIIYEPIRADLFQVCPKSNSNKLERLLDGFIGWIWWEIAQGEVSEKPIVSQILTTLTFVFHE
jgi:hypothetical protein